MIKITVYRNHKRAIYGFKAKNHGDPFVCAGVSALVMNAVNSIERFANEKFVCDAGQDGGLLELIMPRIKDGGANPTAELLLESMLLGLINIAQQYPQQMLIIDSSDS
ncbi:MAG: ribosomal-processing cysteine protease Prp [Clostridiales bacterium]|jgi:uncharacterized protein YsxB (DUF464 family)|nr:ribosomal-processing cysteine protease Prp [Clostridiales bacterium]